jgi:hypothetical protein
VKESSQQNESLAELYTHIKREQHTTESARIELAIAQLTIETQAEKINELIRE